MTDAASPAFSWVCPECARRVPTKIAACRCGYALPTPESADTERVPHGVDGPSPRRRPVSAVVIAVTVAAVSGLAAFSLTVMRQDDSPRRAAPTVNSPAIQAARATPAPEPAAGPALPVAPADAPQGPEFVAASDPPAPAPIADAAGSSLEDTIGRAMPAVVRVETPRGAGSGFFVASDTILTNVHVVTNNAVVTVRKPNGSTMQARVESSAPEFDIAVLRVANGDPSQAVLGMASGTRARPGQEIVALGSPLGLQNTVTRGIVSAVRQVGGVTLVQTDAAINPGNSGGPLVDRTGQVIGIATMGVQSSVAQGLSFGVAIEHARGLLAGERTATTAPTPIARLNEAMTGRPAVTEAETARGQAARGYEKDLAAIARQADALDGRWRSFKSSCYEGRVAGAFDHEWFALW
jgi:S1-C subfamily serine protease